MKNRIQEKQLLPLMNWNASIHRKLTSLLSYANKNKKKSLYAVFDWDDTCAHQDVQDTFFRYQLEHLRFELTPDQFEAIFRTDFKSVTYFEGPLQGKTLAEIHERVIQLYRGRPKPGSSEHVLFKTLMGILYLSYQETPYLGKAYAYTWVLFLCAGMTKKEISALARKAIESALCESLHSQKWQSGEFSYEFKKGLRIQPEMQSLIHALTQVGVQVYIISASLKNVVDVFAGKDFGYRIGSKNIFAMELLFSAEKAEIRMNPRCIPTFRSGKVAVIEKHFKRRGSPFLIAGDSIGDFEMLTHFKDLKLGLVIEKTNTTKELLALKKKKNMAFQFRDEKSGLFISSRNSVKSKPKAVS